MAENKCRACRREGAKLFSKGGRCVSPKCPIERKGAVVPGSSTTIKRRTRRLSDYGRQLREKQKMKRLYGLSEKQFKNYFAKAKSARGQTAEKLIQFLESRLDNLVFRLGFAPSRKMARQIIAHGHVNVDGRKVDIPSYLVREGQTISLSSVALKIPAIVEVLGEKGNIPSWLERKAVVGKLKRIPKRDEIDIDANEQAVVEYYSK
ncbi:MAG: 30S ribosomal protein S4 [bacterium]|nr:30S ribosomal protein S4 [bacterium]